MTGQDGRRDAHAIECRASWLRLTMYAGCLAVNVELPIRRKADAKLMGVGFLSVTWSTEPMTTAQQDRQFNQMLMPTLTQDASLQNAIDWISDNMNPNDVFSDADLAVWAEN